MRGVLVILLLLPAMVWAVVFGSVRGIVHDPDHRPVANARVTLKSTTSDYSLNLTTGTDGTFESAVVPVGAYQASVILPGFESSTQPVMVVSGSAPILHFQLVIGTAREEVNVSEGALTVSPEAIT